MPTINRQFAVSGTLNTTLLKYVLAILSLASLSAAHAHGVQGGGFVNGLMHPVFGPDHLLAMVAVGILSVQIGGKALWTVPTAFVALMLLGGFLGMQNVLFPAVETGIAASVLALGVALASYKNLPVAAAMVFVGVFALFHGYAHGQEMPAIASPWLYALGFVIATASLHIVGLLIGVLAHKIKNGDTLLRYTGAGIAGIGFAILTGI